MREPDKIAALLDRMRDGDREAAARFIDCYGSRLRRRIRRKLSPPVRRILDTDDAMSVLAQRFDRYVEAHHLQARDERQLWHLVAIMSDHVVVDFVKIFRRLEGPPRGECSAAYELAARRREAEQRRGERFDLDEAMHAIHDRIDREILDLRGRGCRPGEIAGALGLSTDAVRKRWRKIRSLLRKRLRR